MDEAEDDVPGVPEWVVTYGDMMSLLLTFFIMLVSLSQMKEDGDLRAMLDSYIENFGPTLESISGVPGVTLQANSIYNKKHSRGSRSEGGVKKSSKKAGGPSGAYDTVNRISHGTVVTLGGPAMFDTFSADISEPLKNNLDLVYASIASRPNRVVVRGHASPEPLPLDSLFADSFGLSFARAQVVADYLIKKGVKRDRIRVSAAGDTEPKMLSRKPDDQKYNHRVDVFLIDSYISAQ